MTWKWPIVVGLFACAVWLSSQPGEWHVTGEGTATGYVTGVLHEGWVWRTWSVHFKTDAESTQEDRYCVRAASSYLVPSLRGYAEQNQRVELQFTRYLRVDYSECEGSFFAGEKGAITGVRPVKEGARE